MTGKKTRFHLLALDGYYDEEGNLDKDKTDLLIPNDFIIELTECLNNQFEGFKPFVPVISIHPYRGDAIKELARLNDTHAVRFIKWLPNVMRIDPSNRKIIPFYRELEKRKITLISHTGGESTLISQDENQRFGNPQLLKLPLDLGVRVIMAHSGRSHDTEDMETGKEQSNFSLFLKMMRIKKYEGLLFGDLTALTLGRTLDHLNFIAEEPYLKNRILNGSDYPLPAVYFLVQDSLGQLKKKGFLNDAQAELLK
ncbi:MAG: amidohydrolase, partial [Deltaproteobacteria bacterium]|nr:amidohydrolase [Deltaproteobacteria bacterium]